jgi:RHS repeat-associated protein
MVLRTTPDGGSATATFTNWGNPTIQYVTTAIADGTPDGLWTRTYVDGLGRTVRVVDEGGITVDTTYGVRGLVTKTSEPYLTGATPVWTETTYDALRRPTQVKQPDGAITTTAYGNWMTTTTNPRGLVTDRSYDAYRQLVRVAERIVAPVTTTTCVRSSCTTTTTLQTVSTYTTNVSYDLLGRRVAIVDARGNVTTSTYDPLGRRSQASDPDLGTWQYGYDDAGHVTSQTDARGVVIATSYDALGRPLVRSDGSTTLAAFSYDEVGAGAANIGRLTSFVDPTGSTRRDYDAGGRVVAEIKTIGDDTYQIDWGFDVAGRVTSIRYPDVGGVREQVLQSYDASGRVIARRRVRGWRGLRCPRQPDGGDLRQRRDGGPQLLADPRLDDGADGDGRRSVRDQFAVTRSLAGDITARTSSHRRARRLAVRVRRARPADRRRQHRRQCARRGVHLRRARRSAHGGARRRHHRVPVPRGRRTAPARADDDRRRRRCATTPTATASASAWRSTRSTTPATAWSMTATVTYAYDAEGTRVRAGSKVFVRDLIEVDGATSTRYYYLGRERVARRDQDRRGRLLPRRRGRHGARVDRADGAVAGARSASRSASWPESTGLADPFGIAGQRRDASGLYHMGARMMDPAHGQFTQPDPSGAPDPSRPQSLNRYAYAGFQTADKEDNPEDETARPPAPEDDEGGGDGSRFRSDRLAGVAVRGRGSTRSPTRTTAGRGRCRMTSRSRARPGACSAARPTAGRRSARWGTRSAG